jgi:hypothetical protein
MGGGIKMDLREIGWKGVECFHLAQDRDRWWALVNMVMNLHVLEPQLVMDRTVVSHLNIDTFEL